MHGRTILLTWSLLLLSSVTALAQQGYQQPPKAVREVLDVPASPTVSLSPTRDKMLLVESSRYPSIAQLAQPMLRLAGWRSGGVDLVSIEGISDDGRTVMGLCAVGGVQPQTERPDGRPVGPPTHIHASPGPSSPHPRRECRWRPR